MDGIPTLEDALILAATAHSGQVDKAGMPYVLHPIRVMIRVSSPEERIVALLHDVVEDTPVTFDELRERGYPERILTALDGVTNREGESYEEFVDRAGRDPISRAVKLADLADNMDLSRLPHITDKDRARLAKYEAAVAKLTCYPAS